MESARYFNKIQDFDEDFYRGLSKKKKKTRTNGLDDPFTYPLWERVVQLIQEYSQVATSTVLYVYVTLIKVMIRCALQASLLNYEDDMLDQTSIIPMVDGGTEGFKGNARVVIPGMTACVECSLDLYPPQITFPLCTIANIPRLPEHCIEYVRIFQWPKENPFGNDTAIDGDDPEHLQWIFEQAQRRAQQYNISNVTYRLTQGVIKHIIPAVASTNAVIAAICATEVFKLATSGLYTYTFEAERKSDCLVCSQKPRPLRFSPEATLKQVFDHLVTDPELQMKSPGMTTMINNKNRTLYMPTVKAIEEATRKNLSMTLQEISTKTKTSSIKEKFWNFKKANWNLYQQNTNEDFRKAPTRIKDLEQNWISFKNTIIKAAKVSIPRGNSYQMSSKIKFEIKDKKVEKKARKIIHDCKNVTSTHNIFHEKINMKELDYALENTDLNKTPGPDGIHGQMISNLGKNGKEKLLDIFNNSWKTGKLPQDWKTATIIPIKKLDKSADDPKNYRPISLTKISYQKNNMDLGKDMGQ
ncbi:UBA3 [Cordylochernes scorpioides]|uniref:UBA3 n=1 Tax=Cordylochernes scorpioides TaxID=51811 RepID=A0ABY6KC76_9ARAC|nr:UBA3 [Cordylochernes scorpioides]